MLSEGDVVVLDWQDGMDGFTCPVCGNPIHAPNGLERTQCDTCDTLLCPVSAARIEEVGERPEHYAAKKVRQT